MRLRLFAVFGFAVVSSWAMHCGPGSVGSTTAPDGGVGASNDAGTDAGIGAAPDAGSGSGGGSADAGADQGGGTPDAGGGDNGGGTGGGGGGSADAGSGDSGGGNADAGSGSADAGSGGGNGNAECDSVVPGDLGSASSATVSHPSGAVCWSATSDGNGYVIAEAHNPAGPPGAGWTIFSPGGAQTGTLPGDLTIAAQPNGFQTNYIWFPPDPPAEVAFSHWSETGDAVVRRVIGSDACGPAGAFPVPGGGSVVVIICGNSLQGVAQALRFDVQGQVLVKPNGFESRASMGLTFPAFPATVSVTATGDASGNMLLVIHPGSAVGLGDDDYAAQWFDPYGSALTKIFVAAKGSGDALLRPLVSGEVALQVDGVWKAKLLAGTQQVGPVPDWLASHPHYDFKIVRAGRAYALMPRTGAPNNDTLEFVTPSGQSCGTKTFPVGGLSIGFDGTVISSSGDAGCSKTWWPGLLK